jgi:NAD(P)-dependent dehydrogenase (short-subunit alcohol dehydrogenase family)
MAGHSWRSLLFGVEGWRHFLKSGYAARAKHFDDAPFARDLRGTHVVVTGANQGIGFQVAKQLALQRASVHMVCRSEERGEKALRALKEEVAAANADGSPPDVTLDVCDVSDAKAVRAFARAYVESGRPLHCLVNNAGCMVHERTLTPEGMETNFATNTLGTYALTEGLLPSLERTAAREKARDDPSFRQRRSYTLVPIRPRWRGGRRSLRTSPVASLRPHHAFSPRSSQQLRTSPARRLRFSPRARASLSIYYRQTAPPFNSDRRRSIRPSLRRTRG